jgi:hypothetical protein
MKFIKIFLVNLLLVFSNFLFSQKITLSNNQILKIFKSTIEQDDRSKISVGSNAWFTENTNGKYLNDKIIELRNARSFKQDYCKIIYWTFYRKDSFIISDADHCNEPPLQKVTKSENYINLDIREENFETFLLLFNKEKLVDKFLIISLEKIKSVYDENESDLIMKLKRLN